MLDLLCYHVGADSRWLLHASASSALDCVWIKRKILALLVITSQKLLVVVSQVSRVQAISEPIRLLIEYHPV